MNLNSVTPYALRKLNVIQLYEFKYIDQETFFNLITGAGQRTIAEEGLDRFKFYLEREAGRIEYDFFLTPYKKSSMQ
jgi:hypothetical protein